VEKKIVGMMMAVVVVFSGVFSKADLMSMKKP
jgi:hypothetical protein